jgi:hypothetical protein
MGSFRTDSNQRSDIALINDLQQMLDIVCEPFSHLHVITIQMRGMHMLTWLRKLNFLNALYASHCCLESFSPRQNTLTPWMRKNQDIFVASPV